MPRIPQSFALVALLFMVPALSVAADGEQLVATDITHADADFHLQGEYYGSLYDDFLLSNWKTVGLQVVALGNGQFDGVLYAGGLPGSGWDEYQIFTLTGSQVNGTLDLKGNEFRAIIESGYALIHAANGQPLGQITLVHRVSPSLGAMPPWGSRSIFDGTHTHYFEKAEMSRDNLLKEGALTKDGYRDFTMHLEFLLPYMPYARGQGRGNSGVYIEKRYEVQILDSFGLDGADNECAGLYKQRRPDINMCLPPLSWQTYDIEFHSPQFDDLGNKTRNAQITVWHNGVAVHHKVDITAKTGGGAEEGPDLLPILLQDHHNPVRFRNIWIVDHSRAYPQTLPHPYPPVADPWIQYGVYVAPMIHYRAWEYPLPPRRAPSWFYYRDEMW